MKLTLLTEAEIKKVDVKVKFNIMPFESLLARSRALFGGLSNCLAKLLAISSEKDGEETGDDAENVAGRLKFVTVLPATIAHGAEVMSRLRRVHVRNLVTPPPATNDRQQLWSAYERSMRL